MSRSALPSNLEPLLFIVLRVLLLVLSLSLLLPCFLLELPLLLPCFLRLLELFDPFEPRLNRLLSLLFILELSPPYSPPEPLAPPPPMAALADAASGMESIALAMRSSNMSSPKKEASFDSSTSSLPMVLGDFSDDECSLRNLRWLCASRALSFGPIQWEPPYRLLYR